MRAAALKKLDKAARYMRDTLWDEDEHDDNSTVGSDSCNEEPAYLSEDGVPSNSSVPSPWRMFLL